VAGSERLRPLKRVLLRKTSALLRLLVHHLCVELADLPPLLRRGRLLASAAAIFRHVCKSASAARTKTLTQKTLERARCGVKLARHIKKRAEKLG
jgi:hypothetical protein